MCGGFTLFPNHCPELKEERSADICLLARTAIFALSRRAGSRITCPPFRSMSLSEKRAKLIADLQFFDDPQDRLAFVIDAARKRPPLPTELKIDAYKVEGCLSNLWLVPEYRGGRCWFRADGDSMIVKGIAGLLADFYNGELPEEILKMDPSFLAPAGITQHLSQNRKNGLGRVWQKIQRFAAEHIAAEKFPQASTQN